MVGNSPQWVTEQPVHLPSLINDAYRQGVAAAEAVPNCGREPKLPTSPPLPSTKRSDEEQPAAEQASRWEQDPAPFLPRRNRGPAAPAQPTRRPTSL